MKKDNEEEVRQLLKRLHKAGKTPALSRAQKKMMLQEILPQKPFMLRFAPAMMAVMLLAFTFISYPAISASKPNSILYDLKRGIEDVRSFVQPSFNEELLDRRDAEIDNAMNQGDTESVLIIEKEKSEIEKRIDATQSTSGESPQVDDSLENESQNHTSNDDVGGQHEETYQNDTHESGSTTTSTQQSARDACKSDLDARKRSGENINSDMYKECDRL